METRTCAICGGRVDVMPVPDLVDDTGQITPQIAACERCGTSASQQRLDELAPPATRTPEEKLHY
jgi:hypothetical protein